MQGIFVREGRRAVVLSLLLIAVLYLPFLNKAVHIDDATFLAIAASLDAPRGQEVEHFFLGQRTRLTPFTTIHPMMPYLLKFVKTVTGADSVGVLHLVLLIFPAVLVVGIKGISDELDIPFLPAVLFIVGSAAFLPVGHTLMADAPMLALWVLSFSWFLKGLRREDTRSLVLSLLTLLVAMAMGYQSAFLAVLFLLFVLVTHRERKTWVLLFFAPFVLLGAALMYLSHSGIFSIAGILGEARKGLGAALMGERVLSLFITVGVIALFLNPLLFLKKEDGSGMIRHPLAVASCAVISLVSVLFIPYSLPERIWLFILMFSGLLFLTGITLSVLEFRGERSRKNLLLLLFAWLFMVIGYNFFMMPFIALRYLLPALVPAVVLTLMLRNGKRLLFACAVLTAVLGVMVAYGDYRFASAYRDLPDVIQKETGGGKERIWYVGDWGMQYYMNRKGYRYLTMESTGPQKGDLVFISHVQRIWEPSSQVTTRLVRIDEIILGSPYPVRVMGEHVRAGYYGHLWGLQPFTISSEPIEKIGVFRVVE